MSAPTPIQEEGSIGSSQFTDPDGKKTDEKGDDEAAEAEKDLMVWKETVAVKRAKVCLGETGTPVAELCLSYCSSLTPRHLCLSVGRLRGYRASCGCWGRDDGYYCRAE
jgi:hypothetical protein